MCRRSLRTFVVMLLLAVAVAGCALAAGPVPTATPAPPAAPAATAASAPAAAPTAAPAAQAVKPLKLLAPDLTKPVEGALQASWEAVPGAAGYHVSLVDMGTSELIMQQDLPAAAVAVTQTLVPGHGYLLGVDALDPAGQPIARFNGEFKAAGRPVPPAAEAVQQLPANCYREGLLTYVDRAARLCFAYPQGFSLAGNQGTQASNEIRGPAAGSGPEPLFASLSLEFLPYGGQDLGAFVDELLKTKVPAGYPAKVERRQATFGGLAAEVLEPMPGRLSSRMVVVDAAPHGYHILTFWPSFRGAPAGQVSAEARQAEKDMEALYEIVSASFSGLPPAGVPIDPAARLDLPKSCLVDGRPLYLDTNDGYCFALTPQMRALREDNGRVGFYGPALDNGPDPVRAGLGVTAEVAARDATLDQVVENYVASYKELAPAIQRSTLTMGGAPAVRLANVPGRPTAAEILLLDHGTLFQFRFTPDESFAASKDDVSALIQTVAASFGFLPGRGAASHASPAAGDQVGASIVHGATISLSADAALAQKITARAEKAILPDGSSNYPDWRPVQARFSFEGYPGGQAPDPVNPLAAPQVLVYRAADIQAFGMAERAGGYTAQRAALQKLLAERPDLARFVGVVPVSDKSEQVPALPFLPVTGARQELIYQPAYVKFNGGQGIRYVTAFVQSVDQLNYQDRLYTFQGLSDDGEYYISAIFPITGDKLPRLDAAAGVEKWLPALQEAVKAADGLPADGFRPSLALLDKVVESITVAPAAAAGGAPGMPPMQLSAPYQGVTFAWPGTLAEAEGGRVAPAAGSPDDPWWVAAPQHVEFSLNGYAITQTAIAPMLAVYPVDQFVAVNQEAAKRIGALQKLLQTRPENPAGELPFLPLWNARQQMHARLRYLAFRSGAGISYLTQYGQGPTPLNNQELFYTFQGLTLDGKYYVAAVLPVHSGLLPATPEGGDRAALAGDYAGYLQDLVGQLAAQDAAAFRPDLADLDVVAESIAIAGAPPGGPAMRTAGPYEGITFNYPAALAAAQAAQTIPAASGGGDAPWWAAAPQHVEFALTGYAITPTAVAPLIAVYPADQFAAANPEAAKRIAALQELLQARPADPQGQLPFLPLYNAGQQVHARVKYLPFPGGQGVSYLTQYGQAPGPINNRELLYTFQGLTADGKHYVAVVLPVSSRALPADPDGLPAAERAAMLQDYGAYVQDVTARLNAQNPAAFQPALADCEYLVESLLVEP